MRMQSAMRRKGATIVELAMVLPMFLMLIFAGFELTRVAMLKHIVDYASYEACRAVIVPGATASEAETAANELLNKFGITGAVVTVKPSTITEATASVTVDVVIPVDGNALGLAKFSTGQSLESSTRMVTERVASVQSQGVPPPPPKPLPPPDDGGTSGGDGSGGDDSSSGGDDSSGGDGSSGGDDSSGGGSGGDGDPGGSDPGGGDSGDGDSGGSDPGNSGTDSGSGDGGDSGNGDSGSGGDSGSSGGGDSQTTTPPPPPPPPPML